MQLRSLRVVHTGHIARACRVLIFPLDARQVEVRFSNLPVDRQLYLLLVVLEEIVVAKHLKQHLGSVMIHFGRALIAISLGICCAVKRRCKIVNLNKHIAVAVLGQAAAFDFQLIGYLAVALQRAEQRVDDALTFCNIQVSAAGDRIAARSQRRILPCNLARIYFLGLHCEQFRQSYIVKPCCYRIVDVVVIVCDLVQCGCQSILADSDLGQIYRPSAARRCSYSTRPYLAKHMTR